MSSNTPPPTTTNTNTNADFVPDHNHPPTKRNVVTQASQERAAVVRIYNDWSETVSYHASSTRQRRLLEYTMIGQRRLATMLHQQDSGGYWNIQ